MCIRGDGTMNLLLLIWLLGSPIIVCLAGYPAIFVRHYEQFRVGGHRHIVKPWWMIASLPRSEGFDFHILFYRHFVRKATWSSHHRRRTIPPTVATKQQQFQYFSTLLDFGKEKLEDRRTRQEIRLLDKYTETKKEDTAERTRLNHDCCRVQFCMSWWWSKSFLPGAA